MYTAYIYYVFFAAFEILAGGLMLIGGIKYILEAIKLPVHTNAAIGYKIAKTIIGVAIILFGILCWFLANDLLNG